MATVCLHIGAMKSGTSYLQHILSANKDLLLSHGVLFPGRRWRDQVAAAEDAVGIYPKGKAPKPGSWEALAEEVRAFDGRTSVISMETLSAGGEQAARRVVESFPDHQVRVILTARDLARVVPAQWQESIKNGAPLSYDKFLALIATPGARSMPGARAFWGPQDLGRILRTWQPLVDPPELFVVTVPPRGSAPALLWERFAAAAGLPEAELNLSVAANESLGEASAELLRKLNQRAKQQDASWEVKGILKQAVAKQILAGRADRETPLTVPLSYRPWVAKTADHIVAEIEELGPAVVGDLDELRVPPWRDQASGAGRLRALRDRLPVGTAQPTSEADQLAAALEAILGLSQRVSAAQRRRDGRR